MSIFPPHATDGYKTGHRAQYPEGTEFVYSNLTFRSDKHAKVLKDFDHKIVWFGAQAVVAEMQSLWQKEFFDKPRAEVVARYTRRMDAYLGAGVVSPDHIGELHDLGYLPLRIKSLPEGSRVNVRVAPLTIINTDPRFFWLTNYVETYLSAELWKAVTSATSTYEFRRLFEKYADLTGVDKSFVDFQGHNFADRGMSGMYDARSSGAGHLLSFKGTDSILAIDYIEEHYMLPGDEAFIGGSVPATEHSVSCCNIAHVQASLEEHGHFNGWTLEELTA